MSTVSPTREHTSNPPTSSQSSKSQRVLACVLCQQRKVKCDRKFPCANCTKFKTQCVPMTSPRLRKRRFPERELLDRIRKYENLLRKNNVQFEPLHKDDAVKESPKLEKVCDLDNQQPESRGISTPTRHEELHGANFWHAMRQHALRNSENRSEFSQDDMSEAGIHRAWDQLFAGTGNLPFSSRKTALDLSGFHPEPVQIFRLWQMYLNNVDPLLKVTHTPSMQGRIIEAASNVANINPTFEALMFSIYSISIMSLTTDECRAMFGSLKENLLSRYQLGCQQALLNCGYLRTCDRECLTAFYLFLVSIGPSTDPQSLSSMLGVGIRIANRMGLDNESTYGKCTAFEAEMRRRLWWSLVLFDTRIGELANWNPILAPTWDCKLPLNVNDSALWPEMKEPPVVQGKSSEALFAIVRSELAEFTRHVPLYIGVTNPAFKPIAKDSHHCSFAEGHELATLEQMVEDNYLHYCDPENPLHFMTIWTTRGYLAKCRLVEYYSQHSLSSEQHTETQRNTALSRAFSMLDCDTKVMTSPRTKGYRWLAHGYFPLPAYIHIVEDLQRRPVGEHAEQAWEFMSANFEARFSHPATSDNPLFKMFSRIILQAWDARETALGGLGQPPTPPRIVSRIQHKIAQTASRTHSDHEQGNTATGMGTGGTSGSMSMSLGSYSLLYGSEGQDSYTGMETGMLPRFYLPGQSSLNLDVDPLDWAAMDWSFGYQGW
ncbi:hypothetical protein NUU61_003442 [Penicillium alfredii]|uniref:Zn(2)-C6 fungal-type domain-containing protein n=1 Tax=Penicillium alfredii TaxID=1506179 RepID=A0A9W9KGX7_9EURO|nr:uncharacterized protein NUU61_003442 [Penicillium alfredii]KAJ5106095.1 hypothetical protein NUU61_003442 [Penicillium alfredii]